MAEATVTKTKITRKPKGKKKGKGKKAPEWNPQAALTLNEEIFCRYYVQNENTRRNATISYALAYGRHEELLNAPDDDAIYEELDDGKGGTTRGKMIQDTTYKRLYNVCATEGSTLLKKPKISRRLTELLNELLTDNVVDAELAKVIVQDEDLSPKVRAIQEYNTLKKRTTETKIVHQFGNLDPNMSEADLDNIIENSEAFFKKKPAKKKS